jgi:hypothetical protein
VGGFTNLVFAGFFLEGHGEGGFTKLAFIECDSRGDGSGIA